MPPARPAWKFVRRRLVLARHEVPAFLGQDTAPAFGEARSRVPAQGLEISHEVHPVHIIMWRIAMLVPVPGAE
jgi:hypothetical protein